MKHLIAVLVIAFAVLSPLAFARTGDGGSLSAASPATVEGLANTLLPAGVASFVGASSAPILFHLQASEVTLQVLEYAPCMPAIPGAIPTNECGAGASPSTPRSVTLHDATVSVVKPLSAFKVIVTTDRQYADTPSWRDGGNLLVATSGTTRLGTNADAQYLHMQDDAWSADASRRPYTPYTADASSAMFSSSGAGIQASDGFEAFLQGVQVSVKGTASDGTEFKETFDTRVPRDGEPWRALVAEVSGGELAATSTAPFLGFAPPSQRPVTDVHAKATFTEATGTVRDEGGPTEYDRAPATLAGPVSLRLDAIESDRLTYTITPGLQLANLAPTDKDRAIPPAALAAAGVAGAGGASALVALAFFWPRLKYAWTLMLLPMYTRIERDAVLEHEKRDELYELIRVTPGIHAHEIGEKARIGWGTTVYHLKLLENHGLIVSKKTGRYKRFFVNTGEYTKKKDIYGALRNETAKSVADHIVKHPGTTQKEMCAALGIQPSLASWHVEKLEAVELVKRVKDGRMVRYFAGPAWADLNVRIDPLGGVAETPVET